ncbi:MAG: hypothetical protein ACYS5V_11700 [Planctomycetota bacterium]|jgi:hypothetical protein
MTAPPALLSGPLCQRLGWTLVHFLWQGAAVAAALAVAGAFLCTATDTTVAATPPADATAAKELERLWGELASNDRGRADKAAEAMTAIGDKAVAFLRSRLLDAHTLERVKGLITDLDDDRWAVRTKAHKAIEDIGRPALPALTRALDDKGVSPETRWRLTQLVAKLTAPPGKVEMRRLGRAVRILGRIKTEPAREVLRRLAGGPPDDAVAAAARRAMLPWARQEFLAASAFLCDQGGSRGLAARQFAATADGYPGYRNVPVARELAGLLTEMAKQDAKFREPKDPAALPANQRIDYLVYKLRDVHERAAIVPSKVRVLGFSPPCPFCLDCWRIAAPPGLGPEA